MLEPSTAAGPGAPAGTVTFLFTDIEGSTQLYQTHPEAMQRAMARHHEILQRSISTHRGQVFQIIGDAFHAAFVAAPDALDAAVEGQRALPHESWGELNTLRVRMALYTDRVDPLTDWISVSHLSVYAP